MCGRYDLTESPQMLMLYFALSVKPEAFSNGDIRPTNTAPIIRDVDGQRIAGMARWGLIPSWWKNQDLPHSTFNAKSETLTEKRSFRTAFKRRRCIVPVSAFFEWQAIPGQKKKQKLRFASPDKGLLALAGLWDHWKHPETGEIIESYTIITTVANELMAKVHDRMPVILDSKDWKEWLDPAADNPLLLQSMLQPCPDEWLMYSSG